MALMLAVVAVVGLIIGLRFRAPAILAATLVVALAAASGIFLDQPVQVVFLRVLYLVVSLQGGYLVGLAWMILRHR